MELRIVSVRTRYSHSFGGDAIEVEYCIDCKECHRYTFPPDSQEKDILEYLTMLWRKECMKRSAEQDLSQRLVGKCYTEKGWG